MPADTDLIRTRLHFGRSRDQTYGAFGLDRRNLCLDTHLIGDIECHRLLQRCREMHQPLVSITTGFQILGFRDLNLQPAAEGIQSWLAHTLKDIGLIDE